MRLFRSEGGAGQGVAACSVVRQCFACAFALGGCVVHVSLCCVVDGMISFRHASACSVNV